MICHCIALCSASMSNVPERRREHVGLVGLPAVRRQRVRRAAGHGNSGDLVNVVQRRRRWLVCRLGGRRDGPVVADRARRRGGDVLCWCCRPWAPPATSPCACAGSCSSRSSPPQPWSPAAAPPPRSRLQCAETAAQTPYVPAGEWRSVDRSSKSGALGYPLIFVG